jgi:hypothetical protein
MILIILRASASKSSKSIKKCDDGPWYPKLVISPKLSIPVEHFGLVRLYPFIEERYNKKVFYRRA